MDEATQAAIVWTTAGSEVEARNLATSLVEGRLAACVPMIRIESCYEWAGTLERAEEILLLIKTTAHRYRELEAHVVERHPFEVPEILMTPVADGLPAYLDWLVRGSMSTPPPSGG